MTHDIETELTDEQLAEAVGGSGVAADRLTLTGSVSDPALSPASDTGRTRLLMGSEAGIF